MLAIDICGYLIVVSVILIILYLKNYFKAVALAFKLRGPPSVPLLGNVLIIKDSKSLEYLGTHISELYPSIVRFWISLLPFFLVYEPKDLQVILSTNKYTTKNMFYTFLHNFIGDGLITNSGNKWKQHRKLIQPCFHVNTLKIYFDAIYESSNTMVQNLEGQSDVNIIRHANKLVLDVLHDTILGVPIRDKPEFSPFRMGKLFMPYRLTRPWLLFNTIFKITAKSKKEIEHKNVLQEYTKGILEQRKNSNSMCSTPPNNLLEMMLEISKADPEFKEEDIINEACTFMLAGQDSIGAALTFSLYFLAAYKHIQDKVVEELNVIFKNSRRRPTFEDVSEMKYLEQCIKEAMRLCPSVPMIARKLTEDLTLGKWTLPKGTNILISPFATHRLPHIFPKPLEYDPDRFSAENKTKIHPYGYIPFSAGPRNCIGYKFAFIELKTVISEILRKYHLSLTPGHEKFNLSYRITLKAKNGIWIRLHKRNSS